MSQIEPDPESPNERSSESDEFFLLTLLKTWFGFGGTVSQKAYVLSGAGLMLFKYGVESLVVNQLTGLFFSPIDFLNPRLAAREKLAQLAPEWLGWAWFLWSLPFLWIAVTMSVRRAIHAGKNPWIGMLILVPIVNLVTMLVLACLPKRAEASWLTQQETVPAVHNLRSAVLGVGLGFLIALLMMGVSVYAFDTYGASLFLGTPILMGAVASVIFNSPMPRSYPASIGIGVLTITLAGGALIVFALEGAICILMAAPIALPLGGLGGVIGKLISEVTTRPVTSRVGMVILFLPGWAGVESLVMPSQEFRVRTAVDIDAPPEQVWDSVIGFDRITSPEEWYFRWGIASPLGARIDGAGVGAVRYCEFTTGTFVEPVTEWSPPHTLAFTVEEQPAPMFELSPYRHIHPPHLDGGLKSTRGEFRIIPLSNGKTRLEGHTWYEFDMFPHAYWTLWSDLLIHRIHERVLRHVKEQAEAT